MAIRTGYQPARLPQNQQWFQLPLDKMHNILSDAQTKADLARGEVDALSSQTFANLPQDAAAAEQAKLWLRDSADKLVEQYGEDPRTWGAGLTKLRKEIAYRFDPNTGDIGAMQSRVENFKAYQSKLQEQYKDYPELAAYAVNNIKVDPLEASMGDKVSFGVTPPAMKRNVEEKEVTDFVDKTLGNIMAETYQLYGLQEYGSLDEFTKAFASGTMTGIPQEKIIAALTTQIPEEYLYSYQLKALARGATPEQAAQELQVVNPDRTLNENSTMGLKVLGASYGKAYGQENVTYKFIQDKAAIERAKLSQDKINKQLIPWNVPTSQYTYDAPWGKSTEDINKYTTGLTQSVEDVKTGMLVDMGYSQEDAARMTVDELASAVRGTSADGLNTTWTIAKGTPQERTLNMGDEVMENFKQTHRNAEIAKAIANETLSEANATADAALKSKYGITKSELDSLSSQLPEVQGYSAGEIFNTIDEFNSVRIAGSKGGPRYYKGDKELSLDEYNKITDAYSKVVQATTKVGGIDQFKESSNEIKNYNKLYSNELSKVLEDRSKVQAQGISTTDFGGTPEQNEAWQKDLQGVFGAVAQVEDFKVYVPGRSQSITLKAALNEAAKAQGIKPENMEVTQAGKIFRTMQPMPDGSFHWQVDYQVKDTDSGKTKSVKVLFPSDASSALSSSFHDALDNSPEAQAIETLLYAKNFNLNDFKVPGTDMTIKGNAAGNTVVIDLPGTYEKKLVSWGEAKNLLTEYYQIEALGKANPKMSKEEVKNLYEYYKNLTIPDYDLGDNASESTDPEVTTQITTEE